jgi:hypothetical protein
LPLTVRIQVAPDPKLREFGTEYKKSFPSRAFGSSGRKVGIFFAPNCTNSSRSRPETQN